MKELSEVIEVIQAPQAPAFVLRWPPSYAYGHVMHGPRVEGQVPNGHFAPKIGCEILHEIQQPELQCNRLLVGGS